MAAKVYVCPLRLDKRTLDRAGHFQKWDRPCALCGRTALLSKAIRWDAAAVVVCEECALDPDFESRIDAPEAPVEKTACPTCLDLKRQKDEAALAVARDDSPENRRTSEHISQTFHAHRIKAHGARGRPK